jgi:hypothetical protein
MENKVRQKDRGKGSGNHDNSRKGKSKSRLGKIECWNFGKKGHMKKYCRAAKKQRDSISESWVVYSGDSFHSTPHRKHFLYYVQGDFGQVHLGDDAPCKIVGMEKVKIK